MEQTASPSEYTKLSLSFDEIRHLKHELTNHRPYADRISLGFLARLVQLRVERNEDFLVMEEMDFLEGLIPITKTRKERQFKHAPLHPFWHKHYSAPRHLLRNIAERWGLSRGGNKDLSAALQGIANKYGNDPERWQRMLPDHIIMRGYENRAADGLTGDWIIYAKHDGYNYYLDLATHEEGIDAPRLYQKLRHSSQAEFPFVFDQTASQQ
jgi:hypothetical protein